MGVDLFVHVRSFRTMQNGDNSSTLNYRVIMAPSNLDPPHVFPAHTSNKVACLSADMPESSTRLSMHGGGGAMGPPRDIGGKADGMAV